MKKLIAFKLAFVFFLSSLSSLAPVSTVSAAASGDKCENGQCIDKLVDKLEDLGALYKRQCLPKGELKGSALKKYHEENGLTEECWKLITEINHLESELLKHQSLLEERLGCNSGDCKLNNSHDSLNAQLSELNKVEQQLSCTEPKKQAIKKQCPQDMGCVLVSSALGIGGYLAEMMIPEKAKPKDCHLGNDSCLTQLATGFLKAAISFFEGAWDLLKMAGNYAGKKMNEFWNWVKGAEDHSSTSQLAMAKASEDPGFFDMLMKDFPGTMKKIWNGFVAAIKEWMKTDIFCQKWSGVPRFSTCQKPTESFDCIPCKTMVTGLCAVSGVLVAEVVPAFLTGGLLTAAKHGVNGASKIAKMFKVSESGMNAIKNSRAGKIASETSAKIDDVLKSSKSVKAAKTAVEAALKRIRTYLLSPTRKLLKESYGVLTEAAKKGNVFLADTGAKKVLVFSANALKTTGKVILYPIDNPMTTFAFRQGQRTFDKAFKLGAPKLATQTAVTSTLVRSDSSLETLLARIEEAKVKNKTKDLLKLEEELLAKIEPKRAELLKTALSKDNVDFNDLIRNLYPELHYGELAKKVGADKVIAAERQLFLEIESLPSGATKEKLVKKYQQHVIQAEARTRIVGKSSPTPTYEQIIDNARLPDDERFKEAMRLINRQPASPEEQKKLAEALQKAHLAGPDNGVFEYSWSELREKYRILTEGGFTRDEADILIRAGLAGRPPVRELIQPGDTLFSGFAEDILKGDYLKQREELIQLIKKKSPEERQGLLRKVAGMFGAKEKEAQQVIDNFESLYFIDYGHQVDELDNILQGAKPVAKASISVRYDEKAFKNFKEAREYLLKERPEMTKETLLQVHRRMMKGGVENVPAKDLGVIRDGHWYGNVPSRLPIDEAVKKEIMANPYLTWIEDGVTADGKFYGKIFYPNVDHVRKEGLDLIRKNHPELVKEIEEYQGLSKKIDQKRLEIAKMKPSDDGAKLQSELDALRKRHSELSANREKMTQRLVEAMVDDLMDWFTRERTLIGDINTPEKLDQYVNIVAKLQRDLVSIHPLANGNGRSTREFALSYALMKEGFPPPRIIDPNADIYRSLDDWKKMIKHGILASDFLVDDMTERLKFGLPIENSVELITPYTRPPVKVQLKGQKKVEYMDGVEYIDPRLYREVIKREVAANPSLTVEFKENPVAAWDKVHKRVEEVFSKNNIYYKHPKKGIERVALNYVDEDFKLLFGKPSYHDKELYDFKMKTWYSEEITWRGLASKYAEKTEDEIIEMFEQLTTHNASNAVVGKVRGKANPETIRKAALEDFEKYNNDVFGDGLVQMARDHSETGPMYGISYGYSTSKNREVGKAFAMGAMVVGEYGAHRAPELQALLKSRVLVGARRANKDVDLGRLKQVREEFSYKYGRQQEVMGIGASDPDAITIVQTIDEKGDVILSYLRNKDNPKEIFVIKGHIEPDATPDPSQIVKTITLGSKK